MQTDITEGRTKGATQNRLLFHVIRFAQYALLLIWMTVVCEKQAHAYTDPGSGAMLWQMLVAGALGLMFYFRRFLFRFRGK
jgi:hypothetical protein